VFYQVAAPLLYNNVILKGAHSLSKLLTGNELVDRNANKYSTGVVNLKSELLSGTQQLTIMNHSCKRSFFTSDTCPDLKTLLIIPHLDSLHESWCAGNIICPILQEAQPEKVVVYNSRFTWRPYAYDWPMCFHRILVTSPTLTLVIDETEFSDSHIRGLRIKCNDLRETRLIVCVCKTPFWLDKLAHRETTSSEVVDIKYLTLKIIMPFLHSWHEWKSALKTIYLFRAKPNELDYIKGLVNDAIDREYARHAARHAILYGSALVTSPKPTYILKTLNDYIKEGVEDELLEEELQYWREENTRRMKKGKSGVAKDKANQVSD